MEKSKRIHNSFFLLQQKRLRGKECAASGCSNAFYNSGTATGLFIFFEAYFIALRDKLVVYPDKEA